MMKLTWLFVLDIGTTFSGSCFTSIYDDKSIIHVVKWPEQRADDTFEKTPTACLYSKNSRKLLKWGKAALDHMVVHPDDDTVVLVDQFKLKLQNQFQKDKANLQEEEHVYRTAAIDYLREVDKYTCDQIKSIVGPSFSKDSTRYVLTVPATWINQDNLAMQEMAIEAGLIREYDSKEKLLIINEAYAAALFCEREYCVTDNCTSKLFKGQRYLLCDAGGGTIDLATYECTGLDYRTSNDLLQNEHCQLALESGGNCGSTILDQNMERYLREQVFIGCIEEKTLKSLVDQFVKDIKHYFGGDENKNNYIRPSTKNTQSTETVATTLTTTEVTKMLEVRENDYNYKEDYQDQHSDISMDDDEFMNDDDFMFDDEESYEDMTMNDSAQENILLPSDYIYLTLPSSVEGIDPSILENLSLKGDIIHHQDCQQLRISHVDISKHVFDPVVETVTLLIRKQIKKSHTQIDTLFLLGGFGQSPYLYKKLHHEFITSTNMVSHLIVPEDGYRASMRGGIYFGIDNSEFLSRYINSARPLDERFNEYKHLVGIDFNFFDLSATFTLVRNINEGVDLILRKTIAEKDLELEILSCQVFHFDSKRFITEKYAYLVDIFHDYLEDTHNTTSLPNVLPGGRTCENRLYYDCLIKEFIQQLYESMEQACKSVFGYNSRDLADAQFRYTFAPASKRQIMRNVQETSMEQLNSRLLSKLLGKDSVFTPKDVIEVHEYFKKLTFEKALPVKVDDLSDMSKTIFQAASEIGMVQAWNSTERLLWDGSYITKSFLAYRYFFSPINIAHLDNDINFQVFAFSMRDNIGKCRVITCIDKQTNQYKYENRILPLFDMESYGILTLFDFDYPDPHTIKMFIKWNEYTLANLLPFLATKTNCMSAFINTYIKNHVDLSIAGQTHSIRNMFFDAETHKKIKMNFMGSMKGFEYAINHFKDAVVTSELILSLLIEPYIKFMLAPSIVSTCRRYKSFEWGRHELCLIFTGEIVETKGHGLHECKLTPPAFQSETWQDFYTGGETYTWADYLFHFLQSSLEKCFLSGVNTNVHFRILYDNRPDYSRHVDCLMNGTIRYSGHKQEYISGEQYALHLLAFDVKPGQPNFSYKVGGMNHDFSDDDTEKNCVRTKAETVDGVSEKGLTCLHPLIEHGNPLVRYNEGVKSILKFVIPYECSIAAVLYSTKETGSPDYNISNNSFKKLHRFIFPVKDATWPIVLSYSIEGLSLIFNIRQADYQADFKCPVPLYLT
ncbi:hypothetical protein INT47_012409 [Mucor saturninus]|uniref:Uncharacterized protein n=1 Tax=Mucor saturninus TaxID=64648 RepID=A0A8H7QYL4_9FUNG|nr:hypothetical protein INT47_012409 [Mucor saturninus]